jgi:hypothetical protein
MSCTAGIHHEQCVDVPLHGSDYEGAHECNPIALVQGQEGKRRAQMKGHHDW